MRLERGSLWLLLGLVGECAAVFLWSRGVFFHEQSGWAWSAHALAVGLLAGGLGRAGFAVEGLGKVVVLALVVLVGGVPIFGPPLIAVLVLIWKRSSSRAVALFIGKNEVYDADPAKAPDSADVGANVLEILRGNDPERRRRAILGVRTYEPVAAVPVLRRCLQDSDELVRIYAQGILQNLMDRLEGRAKELQERLQEESLDDAERIDFELQLAEALHEQIYTGLVEEESVRQRLRHRARDCLNRAIKLAPEEANLYLLRMRSSLELRDVRAAEADLELIEQKGVNPQQVEPLRSELNFLKRDWRALCSQMDSIERSGLAHGRMMAVCAFWRKAEA